VSIYSNTETSLAMSGLAISAPRPFTSCTGCDN